MIGGTINKVVNTQFKWSGADQGRTTMQKIALGATAVATAAAAAVSTVVALTKRLSEQFEVYNDLSKRLDMSASSLHAWDLRLQDAGISIETITPTFAIMSSNLRDAADGTGEAIGALNDLGISARDLQGLSMEEQFYRLADALAAVEDSSTRMALSRDIFGRGAGNLAAVINEGGEALREYTDAAKESGQVMDDDLYAQADQFSTTMDLLTQRIEAQAFALLSHGIPAMLDYADAFVKGVQGIQALVGWEARLTEHREADAQMTQGALALYRDEIEAYRALNAQYQEAAAQLAAATEPTKAMQDEVYRLAAAVVQMDADLSASVEPILAVNESMRNGFNDLMAYAMGLQSIADVIADNPQIFMTSSVFTGAAGRVSPAMQELISAGDLGEDGGGGGAAGRSQEALTKQLEIGQAITAEAERRAAALELIYEKQEAIAEIEAANLEKLRATQADAEALEAESYEAKLERLQQYADLTEQIVGAAWDSLFSRTRQDFGDMLKDMLLDLAKSGLLRFLKGAVTGGAGFLI